MSTIMHPWPLDRLRANKLRTDDGSRARDLLRPATTKRSRCGNAVDAREQCLHYPRLSFSSLPAPRLPCVASQGRRIVHLHKERKSCPGKTDEGNVMDAEFPPSRAYFSQTLPSTCSYGT
eukprot:scaffold3242_cov351-Prasinococcus_capsulatus_cf.AAC.4